jgi:LacI family transcriptional regulator
MEGVLEHAQAVERWHLRLFSQGPDPAARCLRWQPDGIIAGLLYHDCRRVLARCRKPVVNTSVSLPEGDWPLVHLDWEALGVAAAEFAGVRGFRRAATVSDPDHWWWEPAFESFRRACGGLGVDCRRISCAGGASGDLAQGLGELTWPAILFATPEVAVCLQLACEERGIIIPDQAAVIVCEDDEVTCSFCTPSLTAVGSQGREAGRLAARILSDLMRGGEPVCRSHTLAPQGIVERQSTPAWATDDQLVASALRHMQDNLGRSLNVKTLAAALGVSRRTLEGRFRRATGHSPLEQLHRLQALAYGRAVGETAIPIVALAARFGYTSLDEFSHQFKRLLGHSPRQFRQLKSGPVPAGRASNPVRGNRRRARSGAWKGWPSESLAPCAPQSGRPGRRGSHRRRC